MVVLNGLGSLSDLVAAGKEQILAPLLSTNGGIGVLVHVFTTTSQWNNLG
jgi:hypothetical protein